MKLKYKKVILLTTMSTMGIGLLTLSISQDRPQAKENDGTVQEAAVLMSGDEGGDIEVSLNEEGAEVTIAPTLTPTPSPTPVPSPTPTPVPVYPLEENAEIDKFIDDFYKAKAALDINKIKSMHIDPDDAPTLEHLQSKMMYIEEYFNVKAYAKKGYRENSYIVYAYSEVKFSNIKTLAPGLGKLYLLKDADGSFKIITSDLSPEEKAYYDARNFDEDVLKLKEETDAKGKAAKAQDEDLQIYWEGVDGLGNN